MIGKIPKAGRGFKGIVTYLMHGARQPERPDAKQPSLHDANKLQTNGRTPERANAKSNRVLWTETHNLVTSDPNKAVRVMRATANRSRRCKSPVYHFVISWTPDEAPTSDAMRAIVADTCRDMGLDDHQRIAIAHDDTRHKHVHVVVNRVHHETGRAWNRSQDWVRLEQSLAHQAKARGLRFVPGRHNTEVQDDHVPRNARDGEYQHARRKKQPTPPLKWGPNRLAAERPNLVALFDAATSWDHLGVALATAGLSLERKGQGHVLRDSTSEVKLSDLAKHLRISALQNRFNSPWPGALGSSSQCLPSTPASAAVKNLLSNKEKPPSIDAIPKHPQLTAPANRPLAPSAVDQPFNVTDHDPSGVRQKGLQKPRRKRSRGPKL